MSPSSTSLLSVSRTSPQKPSRDTSALSLAAANQQMSRYVSKPMALNVYDQYRQVRVKEALLCFIQLELFICMSCRKHTGATWAKISTASNNTHTITIWRKNIFRSLFLFYLLLKLYSKFAR